MNSTRSLEVTACAERCCAVQLIIPVATRTQEGAQKLLDTIKCRAFMAEEIALPLKKCAARPCSGLSACVHAGN